MLSSPNPLYFELSWSILSTIGIGNVLFGFLICSITSFSQISAVPLITSASAAIANGLCYYAFYAEGNPVKGKAVASAFADLFWLVQEAGLSFYSFVILSRVLRNRRWHVFASLFWTIIVIISALRIMIAIMRVRSILHGGDPYQEVINNLHIGYFASIASVECISAYFLLTVFASAKTTSLQAAIEAGLFRYLMRSTEVRLALLAVIGVMRAITYSFQTTAQSATNVASQLDRFAYTMECLFPFVMLIDMLASRLVFTDQAYIISSRNQTPRSGPKQFTSTNNQGLYSVATNDHIIEIHGGENNIVQTSSQDHILESGAS
ncbi:Protein MSN1 [Fusarium oxysporum f. sp. albedinis]|nr:Protein MSN1 [Fusarium oxysporum f. sp. albedinis]